MLRAHERSCLSCPEDMVLSSLPPSSAELPEPCGKCDGGVPLGMSTPQSLTSALWSFGVQCVALWSMQKEVSLLRGEVVLVSSYKGKYLDGS